LPEQPEVRIMSDFFNQEVGRRSVYKVEKSPLSKNKCDLSVLDNKIWKISSQYRGKEMMITFSHEDERHYLKIGFAKIGSIEVFDPNNIDPEYFDKRGILRFYTEDKIYAISDFTRYVIWRWSSEWDTNRSPDIITQHNDWRDHLYQSRKIDYFKRPIFNLLTDQRFFNGIGNYTRSEILGRVRFSPFTPLSEVLSLDILREDFFQTCREVLNDSALFGGMQFKFWINPLEINKNKFNKWIRCYNKPRKAYYIKDVKGAKFWFLKDWSLDYLDWAETTEERNTALFQKIYRQNKKVRRWQ
jgi:endonuclease VIII-like 1